MLREGRRQSSWAAPLAVGLPPQEVVLRWAEPPPPEAGGVRDSCRSAAQTSVVSLMAEDGGGGGSRGVFGVAAACTMPSIVSRIDTAGFSRNRIKK